MAEVDTKKGRLVELDILRAFAILGVILIHILGASFQFQTKWGLTWDIYVICDQFLRFAVPVFVFLSGFTLGLKYLHKKFSLVDFYRRRVWRILPWYFFWSAVIYFYTHYIGVENDFHYPLWKLIFLGKVDYHLYFVSMIFQLYLIFPVILFFLQKFSRKFVALVFLFQVSLYLFSSFAAQGMIKLNFLWGDQQQYVFFGTWIFYFVLGVIFAQKEYSSAQIAKLRKISIYLTVLGLILSIADSIWVTRSTGDLIIAARSSRVSVMMYACGWLISAIVWGKKLLGLPNMLKSFLIYLGNRSYIIYLLHTLVIRMVAGYIVPSNFLNLVIFTLLILTISVLLAEFSEMSGKFIFAKVFKK